MKNALKKIKHVNMWYTITMHVLATPNEAAAWAAEQNVKPHPVITESESIF